MVKIDIIAGFLGAGKTTWINKLLAEAYSETIVVIENEFGEIGIDGELLSGYNAQIKEITSGCICCTLFGDFVVAIGQIIADLHPSRILIEPTGIGRSNDVITACNKFVHEGLAQINAVMTIVDATMLPVFIEMGGELYRDQIKTAHTLLVSHIEDCESQAELKAVIEELSALNPTAYIITKSWAELSAFDVLTIAEEQTRRRLGSSNIVSSSVSRHVQNHFLNHDSENMNQNNHLHSHPYEHVNGKHEHYNENEGFSVISLRPIKNLSESDLSDFFSSVTEGRYGEIFRAKCLLTLNDGRRIKGDYVYGRWQQIPYPGKGEDRLVLIGKGLFVPKNNLFIE